MFPEKVSDALAAQRFQIFEDLAKDLAGEVLFPTCFDLVINLRNLLKDPDVSIERVTAAVRADPLISSKLIELANSAAYADKPVLKEVRGAVERLGLNTVRLTSLAIAQHQMLQLTDIVEFSEMANQLWQHSLTTASACYIVAQRMTRIDPDEAYFAGLIHDIGAFYMLFRATKYPELVVRRESLKHLVIQWHEAIGLTLLEALHIPDDVIDAAREHDHLRPAPVVPKDLKDIVYIGNFLAGSHFEWLYQDVERAAIERHALGPQYTSLSDEIASHAEAMATVLM
jgi:HD-like signal output (HDOD) protein